MAATDGSDRKVLRELAKRVREIAALPVMEERRRLWKAHNSLRPARPMVLIFPEGSWRELIPEQSLRCRGEEARDAELELRRRIYYHEHFTDDTVIEPSWIVKKRISSTGWGLEPRRRPSPETLGAWAFDPVIRSERDLDRLRVPEIDVDEAATARDLEAAEELFGDILDVRLKGVDHVSFHLMSEYTNLRGLEQVMWDMADNPAMLHRAMRFLTDGHRAITERYGELNLFSLNNDNTYHSSGGVGYTDELPAPGFDPHRVRPRDLWASAEAQQMALISPEMHEEFVLSYERELLEPFALNGYGCCEDLSHKIDRVLTIPGIRRISISPFADVDRSAERLGRRAIFSWKPQPAHLVGSFDEEGIRAYIAHTIRVARGCVLEMILKDTHTCEHRPERFDRWSALASELARSA